MTTRLDVGDFGFDFACTADWRREKTVEFPNDHRNSVAAELLDHLAQDAANAPDSVRDAYHALWSNPDRGPDVSEIQSELLREVGFSWWPQTAVEFVDRLIEETNDQPARTQIAL